MYFKQTAGSDTVSTYQVSSVPLQNNNAKTDNIDDVGHKCANET